MLCATPSQSGAARLKLGLATPEMGFSCRQMDQLNAPRRHPPARAQGRIGRKLVPQFVSPSSAADKDRAFGVFPPGWTRRRRALGASSARRFAVLGARVFPISRLSAEKRARRAWHPPYRTNLHQTLLRLALTYARSDLLRRKC